MKKYTLLDYREFEEYLEIEEPFFDGYHYMFVFDNEYQASIIKHCASYGHQMDLFEIMIITPEGHFKDPVGHLTNDEVLEKLREVKMIKK